MIYDSEAPHLEQLLKPHGGLSMPLVLISINMSSSSLLYAFHYSGEINGLIYVSRAGPVKKVGAYTLFWGHGFFKIPGWLKFLWLVFLKARPEKMPEIYLNQECFMSNSGESCKKKSKVLNPMYQAELFKLFRIIRSLLFVICFKLN